MKDDLNHTEKNKIKKSAEAERRMPEISEGRNKKKNRGKNKKEKKVNMHRQTIWQLL